MRRKLTQLPASSAVQLVKPGVALGSVLVFCAICLGFLEGCEPPASVPQGVQVYFSPDGGATAAVVHALAQATNSVFVQAYSFTSAPIARALVDAQRRGVKVQVLL
ncbi:MAG TPA: phospholipase D-like domain-containing protein, partial [Verrucomicrobiae bacterium]|nr:phospholipase D-like domain-containing protein [Verrucomicrobiae bacterium]